MEHTEDDTERIISESESKENIEEEPCTSNDPHCIIDEEISTVLGTMEIEKVSLTF